jgi:hypothetical protein
MPQKMPDVLKRAIGIAILAVLVSLNAIKMLLQPIYRIVFAAKMPLVVRTPEERFANLANLGYNFQVYSYKYSFILTDCNSLMQIEYEMVEENLSNHEFLGFSKKTKKHPQA